MSIVSLRVFATALCLGHNGQATRHDRSFLDDNKADEHLTLAQLGGPCAVWAISATLRTLPGGAPNITNMQRLND